MFYKLLGLVKRPTIHYESCNFLLKHSCQSTFPPLVLREVCCRQLGKQVHGCLFPKNPLFRIQLVWMRKALFQSEKARLSLRCCCGANSLGNRGSFLFRETRSGRWSRRSARPSGRCRQALTTASVHMRPVIVIVWAGFRCGCGCGCYCCCCCCCLALTSPSKCVMRRSLAMQWPESPRIAMQRRAPTSK